MTSAPIRGLADARAVTDASLTGLELARDWIADHGGPDLAADLKRPVVDVAWAYDHAFDQLRDRDPALDANDEL